MEKFTLAFLTAFIFSLQFTVEGMNVFSFEISNNHINKEIIPKHTWENDQTIINSSDNILEYTFVSSNHNDQDQEDSIILVVSDVDYDDFGPFFIFIFDCEVHPKKQNFMLLSKYFTNIDDTFLPPDFLFHN